MRPQLGSIDRRWSTGGRLGAWGVAVRSAVTKVVVVGWLVAGVGMAQAQSPTQSAPNATYFVTKNVLYHGEFSNAYQSFMQETNGGALKFVAGPWVDSVCYYAMAGEAAFQAGRHKPALDAFTTALNIYLRNPNWLQQARMDAPPLMPAPASVAKNAPWGRTARQRSLSQFSETYGVQIGDLNGAANTIAKGGGVVVNPMIIPSHVHEIAFCTAWALKRRRELLGPLSPHDAIHQDALATLSRRPGQPNHWTEAWISVQLGLAFAAVGKDAQAKTELERGILAAGRYDHHLTSLALLELGRLAEAADDANTALVMYAEASYAAVQYFEPLVLEEAFRAGFNTHMRTGRRGMFPPLEKAIQWCNANNSGGDVNWLLASLETMSAENAMAIGQTKIAQDTLTRARTRVGTTGMTSSKPGAQYQLILAMSSYYQGQSAAGDQALAKLLDFQRHGSLRLFQIAQTDALRTGTAAVLSPRIAMDVYSALLRDPTPLDWGAEPREALSVLSIPHSVSYENWFDVAIERKEFEKALEISDRCRRHRFLSAQPIGGRLLNLQWLLESPVELLDRGAAIQRQDLLNRYPQYARTSEQMQRLHRELLQMPLVADAAADVQSQKKKVDELSSLAASQELLLRYMAVRREPADLVFPVHRNTKDIQTSLPPKRAILAYFSTAYKTHVFLITNERYSHAEMKNPAGVRKNLEALLHAWALYDGNKPMRADELADLQWKRPAADLYLHVTADLLTGSRNHEELIVVPDALLWYVPFEALQAPVGDTTVSLLQLTRIRYSPTVSMSVGDTRPRRKNGTLGVMLGKLHPREPEEQASLAFDEFARVIPESVAIKGPLVPQANVYSTLFDRLAVFADITPSEGDPLAWAPLPLASKGPGANLSTWLELPWGGPDQIYLPGFHTLAENGFRKQGTTGSTPAVDGREIFMSICGLMATGTRTVLISRWRPGGRSSYDLVREFAQEVPYSTASEAWQRAVRVVSSAPIDPALEPRVNLGNNTEPVKADHPFFWAAFLLADTGAEAQRGAEPAAGDAGGIRLTPAAAEKSN